MYIFAFSFFIFKKANGCFDVLGDLCHLLIFSNFYWILAMHCGKMYSRHIFRNRGFCKAHTGLYFPRRRIRRIIEWLFKEIIGIATPCYLLTIYENWMNLFTFQDYGRILFKNDLNRLTGILQLFGIANILLEYFHVERYQTPLSSC